MDRRHECSTVNDTELPIATMGRAALFKTHRPMNWNSGVHTSQNDFSIGGKYVDGIVRLLHVIPVITFYDRQ